MMWYLVKQYVTLLERDQQERNKESGTSADVIVNGTKVDTEGRPRRSARERTKTSEENKENVEQKVTNQNICHNTLKPYLTQPQPVFKNGKRLS